MGASGGVDTSSCGPNPGVKATGSPINLGTINTKQPGTDYTDQASMAQAYFTLRQRQRRGQRPSDQPVGRRPIRPSPAQIAAAANKLVQSDHVLGIVGTSDIIECSIDHAMWAKTGIFELGAGIAPECWSTPNSASVNMGPRFSSDGATQYVLSLHPNKIAFDQSNVPGTGYIAAGPTAIAGAAHVPIKTETDNVPISDANTVALRLVNDAGSGGAVVLNFTPPEALVILQAAQKLGLENRVKAWACSTPCNTDFLAKALGPKWSHKLFINAELTPPATTITEGRRCSCMRRSSRSTAPRCVTGGMGRLQPDGRPRRRDGGQRPGEGQGLRYTLKSVNAALKGITNYKTADALQAGRSRYGNCSEHIPNNTDYTVTPSSNGGA